MTQIKPLPKVLQKIAKDELFEDPSRIPKDLEIFKLWIEQQPHLKVRMDEQFLIQFLRGCKYSMEKAKEKIDQYYTLKTKYPNILGVYDVDNERFRQISHSGIIVALPKPLNGNGERLMVGHMNYSPDEYTYEELLRPIMAMYELFTIYDPYTSICGVRTIIDVSKLTMAHILHANLSQLKTAINFFEKSLPLRIKAIYYVNIPPVANSFFKILFPLLSEKLRQRIFLCGTVEDLKQHIPVEYLPQYYGGSNGSMEEHIQDLNAKYDEHRQFFKDNANYGIDETLRQTETLSGDNLFGAGGSFRKMEVD
ncbi:alpha-tocopherol transfer protein-like [Musca autumnalis]|uniref:alpha-tocopherol transfer protein-like n=1 Tax=Musca autumnalis TaxID=221902 RepID=UPI003CF2046B